MNNKANNGTVRTEQTKTEHTKHKVEFTHNEKFCNAVIIGLCVVFIILIIVGIARCCQSDIEPVNKAIVGEVETTSAENTIPTLNFTPAQEKDLSKAIKIPAVSGYDMVAGETTQRVMFENPAETDYYVQIGNVNLYDLSISRFDDDSLSNYFDTMPMVLMEVDDKTMSIVRCNKSFREFFEKAFPGRLSRKQYILCLNF